MTFRFLVFMTCLVGCALVSTGCFRGSEWTRGDGGRTEWQIYDGLCYGGGCGLEVPVAPGASVSLTVRGTDMTGLRVDAGTIPVSFTPATPEAGHHPTSAQLQLTPTAAGDLPLVLVDSAGAEVDRAHLLVRAPTAVVCGVLPRGSVDWELSTLEESDTISVSLAASRDTHLQVGCRGSDADGPIMTRYEIHWQSSGSTALRLHDDFSSPPYTSAQGARIYFEPVALGTTMVHVSVGGVTRDLTVQTVP